MADNKIDVVYFPWDQRASLAAGRLADEFDRLGNGIRFRRALDYRDAERLLGENGHGRQILVSDNLALGGVRTEALRREVVDAGGHAVAHSGWQRDESSVAQVHVPYDPSHLASPQAFYENVLAPALERAERA